MVSRYMGLGGNEGGGENDEGRGLTCLRMVVGNGWVIWSTYTRT